MTETDIHSVHSYIRKALDDAGLADVDLAIRPPLHKGVIMAFTATHPMLTSEGEGLWFMRHDTSPMPATCDDFVVSIASMVSRRLELVGTEGCTGPVDDWDMPAERVLIHPIHAYLVRYDGWCGDIDDFEHSDNDTHTIAGYRYIDRFAIEHTSSWGEDMMEFTLSVGTIEGVYLQARPKPGLRVSHPDAAFKGMTVGDVVDLPDRDRLDLRDLAAGVRIRSAFWSKDESGDLLWMDLDPTGWTEWGRLDPLS